MASVVGLGSFSEATHCPCSAVGHKMWDIRMTIIDRSLVLAWTVGLSEVRYAQSIQLYENLKTVGKTMAQLIMVCSMQLAANL